MMEAPPAVIEPTPVRGPGAVTEAPAEVTVRTGMME